MKQIDYWFSLKNKKRIVIKIGSSSLIHKNICQIYYDFYNLFTIYKIIIKTLNQ